MENQSSNFSVGIPATLDHDQFSFTEPLPSNTTLQIQQPQPMTSPAETFVNSRTLQEANQYLDNLSKRTLPGYDLRSTSQNHIESVARSKAMVSMSKKMGSFPSGKFSESYTQNPHTNIQPTNPTLNESSESLPPPYGSQPPSAITSVNRNIQLIHISVITEPFKFRIHQPLTTNFPVTFSRPSPYTAYQVDKVWVSPSQPTFFKNFVRQDGDNLTTNPLQSHIAIPRPHIPFRTSLDPKRAPSQNHVQFDTLRSQSDPSNSVDPRDQRPSVPLPSSSSTSAAVQEALEVLLAANIIMPSTPLVHQPRMIQQHTVSNPSDQMRARHNGSTTIPDLRPITSRTPRPNLGGESDVEIPYRSSLPDAPSSNIQRTFGDPPWHPPYWHLSRDWQNGSSNMPRLKSSYYGPLEPVYNELTTTPRLRSSYL